MTHLLLHKCYLETLNELRPDLKSKLGPDLEVSNDNRPYRI